MTVTSLIDAEPLSATPSNLPTLPTGSYAVPLTNTSSSRECLGNPAQQSAWACANGPSLNLEIISSGNNMPQINIQSGLQPDQVIHYGPQPPQLSHPANLMIMKDKNDRDKGPAYFFQQLYNKIVILEPAFGADNHKRWSIRDIEVAETRAKRGRGSQAQIIPPSDRPWYCFWNDTILEGFIYATQANDNAIQTSAILTSGSTSSDTSGFGASATSASPSHTSLAYYTPSATSGQWPKRQATALPCPSQVKLEERRTQLSPKPYCQQMHFVNGDPVPVDPPATQALDEDEPIQQNRLIYGGNSGQSRRTTAAFRKSVRDMDSTTGACQCQWTNY